jgi:hypothetical protein
VSLGLGPTLSQTVHHGTVYRVAWLPGGAACPAGAPLVRGAALAAPRAQPSTSRAA